VVAGDVEAPRIVKVLARQAGCGCGGLVHPDHAGAHGGPTTNVDLLVGAPRAEAPGVAKGAEDAQGLEPTGHA
jgi:hypothetical protein